MIAILATALLSSLRAELHVHLDGSLSSATLLKAAQVRGLSLPIIGKPRWEWQIDVLLTANFGFKQFDVVNNIIGGSREALGLAAEAFVAMQARNNITYSEVRYDPVRAASSAYTNATLSLDDAVRSIQAGLRRGMRDHPHVVVHQLLCAMRDKPAAACRAIAELAARMRSEEAGGVVGIDLAGDEWAADNREYIACFRDAKDRLGLNTTVHVGETLPWPLHSDTQADVWSAVVQMRADRVGHGYAAASNDTILEAIRTRGVHIEACPTTAQGEGSEKAIGRYLRANVSFSVSRDDPCLGCHAPRSMDAEEQVTRVKLGFTDHDLARTYHAARAHAFGSLQA